ncbi:MAG TPA: hypothetical protein EYP36_07305 [Calditrichaeota bacterium]|nr:hypothetical protein [Calditrichota bacterium]
MDTQKVLQDLLELLEELSIEVKYHRGNFRGGLVYYDGSKYFYLNRKDNVETQISLIASELKQNNLGMERLPTLLENIEEYQN